MTQIVEFPFLSLPQPIQLECIKSLDRNAHRQFRLVNSLLRNFLDETLFIIFVPLDITTLPGERNIGTHGYTARLKKFCRTTKEVHTITSISRNKW
jgi:hypothetical protein